MQVKELVRRYHGQILNCEYGNQWPLNLYTTGYVKILFETTRKGKIKLEHVWAETRKELV